MPQVDPKVVKERARRLRRVSAERKSLWLQSLVGSTQDVLLERGGAGHAGNFATVRLPVQGDNMSVGEIISVRITGLEGDALTGTPA
jgi:threonylcarbamoyladenosine tRNA methylthiotransferase MtaB